MRGQTMVRYGAFGTAYILGTCPMCRGDWTVVAPEERVHAWLNGLHVQDAFPDMPVGEREQLISGIHGPCFDGLFAGENDDETDEEE